MDCTVLFSIRLNSLPHECASRCSFLLFGYLGFGAIQHLEEGGGAVAHSGVHERLRALDVIVHKGIEAGHAPCCGVESLSSDVSLEEDKGHEASVGVGSESTRGILQLHRGQLVIRTAWSGGEGLASTCLNELC